MAQRPPGKLIGNSGAASEIRPRWRITGCDPAGNADQGTGIDARAILCAAPSTPMPEPEKSPTALRGKSPHRTRKIALANCRLPTSSRQHFSKYRVCHKERRDERELGDCYTPNREGHAPWEKRESPNGRTFGSMVKASDAFGGITKDHSTSQFPARGW